MKKAFKIALFAGSVGSIILALLGGMNENEFDIAFKVIGLLSIAYFLIIKNNVAENQ